MKTIGERIKTFDNLEVQTVRTFNELFSEVPITYENQDAEITINDCFDKATRRYISFPKGEFRVHDFLRTLSSELEYLFDLEE